jgi:mannose-1-phosphate guanylyltransferase
MKCLILVGGFGTRLRPLTFSAPKPMVPFCNVPIVLHQIEAAAKVGVKTFILAVSYSMTAIVDAIKEWEKQFGVEIHISVENEPMGTAGPLLVPKAHELLTKDKEPFFMFNSDVICRFPLDKLLAFHRAHGRQGTILVTPVEDPSKYGVVVAKDNGQIAQFIEKPKQFVSNRINAGMYLLETSVLQRVEPRPMSIEREVFPRMASDEQLFAMDLPGYWMDIGQPADYLKGTVLHLTSLTESKSLPAPAAEGVVFKHNVLVHPTAKIAPGAVIGPNVVIGAHASIGAGARLERSVVFERTVVKAHACVRNCILGWENIVGQWTFLNECVTGKDVAFADEIACIGLTVCPHKSVATSETTHGKILM